MSLQIPDKLYFKIGEVAELTGVKPHVLRYWESEFGSFRPAKSRSKQRLYKRKDIDLIFRLKELLYEQGFTIAGARKKLREEKNRPVQAETAPAATDVNDDQMALPLMSGDDSRLLSEIRNDLQQLSDSLGKPVKDTTS